MRNEKRRTDATFGTNKRPLWHFFIKILWRWFDLCVGSLLLLLYIYFNSDGGRIQSREKYFRSAHAETICSHLRSAANGRDGKKDGQKRQKERENTNQNINKLQDFIYIWLKSSLGSLILGGFFFLEILWGILVVFKGLAGNAGDVTTAINTPFRLK